MVRVVPQRHHNVSVAPLYEDYGADEGGKFDKGSRSGWNEGIRKFVRRGEQGGGRGDLDPLAVVPSTIVGPGTCRWRERLSTVPAPVLTCFV